MTNLLDAIIRTSLAQRPLVLLAAVLLLVGGGWTVARSTVDVLPDLDRPIVSVLTEAPGMTTGDVEQRVTWPVEQVVTGATGVARVRSISGMGLSLVRIEFDWNADVYRARQLVSERLQLLDGRLPAGVTPTLAPLQSILGQVLVVGLRAGDDGPDAGRALRYVVDRDVVPRLRAVRGVAQVFAVGGEPTELQVTVDPERLRAAGVSLVEVAEAVRASDRLGVGGLLEEGVSTPTVAVPGLLFDAIDLDEAVLLDAATESRPLRISDIGSASIGPAAVRVGDAGVDGHPGVLVIIAKQPGADTLAITRRVHEEFAALAPGLPAGSEVVDGIFEQATFIERAIENVTEAVRDGALLVVLVLALFLRNLRTTAIVLSALPISIGAAALVFTAFGLTIDTMTLGGLAVAIGTLVDDAIVDVENVHRRLRERAARGGTGPSLIETVFRASSEVRKPVLYGTILVSVVYLPLFFLPGMEGRLFEPIGVAYVVSVFASLVVAMTVTPVLCSLLLVRDGNPAPDQDAARSEVAPTRLGAAAERVAGFAQARASAVLVGLGVVVLLAVATLWLRGRTFLPPFNEGVVQVNLALPAGTGLDVSSTYGARLEELLLDVEGVAHVGRRTGRASGDEHAMPVHISEAVVSFDEDSDRPREVVLDDVRARLRSAFPGVSTSVEQPLQHLISRMLSGVNTQVAIEISGPDFQVLRRTALQAVETARSIDGVVDVYLEQQTLVPQIEVVPDREALARYGVTVDDVAATVGLALGGEPVAHVQRGPLLLDVVVRVPQHARDEPDDLARLPVPCRGVGGEVGGVVLLGDVASLRRVAAPNVIQRENGRRRVLVQHNVSGRALGDVVVELEQRLAPLSDALAAEGGSGYALRVRGQFEAQRESARVITALGVVAFAAVLLVLALHFGSFVLAALLFASRVVVLPGAAAAVLLSGEPVSVATLVGLTALVGIAARNGILLLDRALTRAVEEGEEWASAVRGAARERIAPILMTALTSGIGLLPLVVAGQQPGREILFPVATVLVGGLVASTLFEFLVTPALLTLPSARRVVRRLALERRDGATQVAVHG